MDELYDLKTPLSETATQCNLMQRSNVSFLCAWKHRQAFTCTWNVANTFTTDWGTEMQVKIVTLSNNFYTSLLVKTVSGQLLLKANIIPLNCSTFQCLSYMCSF